MRLKISNTNGNRIIMILAFVLLFSSNSFAGLMVMDIESASFDSVDSISVPLNEIPVQPKGPMVEQDREQSTCHDTTASSASSFAGSALLLGEFECIVNNESPGDWIRESNRCRSRTSPFDLFKPPKTQLICFR